MNVTHDHDRAQHVAALLLTGDVGADERAFLERHLAACPACTTAVAAMERGLVALRSVSVRPEPALVASTQRRVRERALRLREEQARRRGLVLSSMLAAVLTGLTGLSLWRLLDWVGGLAVAPSVWAPVLLTVWFVPGVLAGLAVWAAGAATERRSALIS
jgi:anti-sigma factor RsiW